MGAVPTNKMDRRGFGGTQAIPVAVASRTGNTDKMRPIKATEQAQMEEEERARKRRRNTVLGVLLALLIFAGAVFGITNILSHQSQQYAVPNLVGMKKDDAINALNDKDSHFKLGEIKEDYNDDAPEGQVIEQTPSANKMAEDGTKIDIVVSKGAKPAATVKVPDLTNMTPYRSAISQSKMKHQTPMPKPAIPSPTTFPKDRKRSRFRMLLVLRKHRQLKSLKVPDLRYARKIRARATKMPPSLR